MDTKTGLHALEYARMAVDVASDKQASDIVMLDIRGVSDFSDYFVILTAESDRQLNSLASDIGEALKGNGAVRHHIEGSTHGGWILMDFGDVIVHLFRPDERDFYQLEEIWSTGIESVRIQ